MNIIDQLKSIETSKVAQDTATSFLGGFAGASIIILTPDLNLSQPIETAVVIMHHLSSYQWEYNFWDAAFGGALSTAFGLRLKSAFDSFSSTPTKTITSFPSDLQPK
jgi:hypothetical protein